MFVNEYSIDRRVSSCMTGVYGWMSCALAITAFVAYYIAHTPVAFMWVNQSSHAMGLIFAQLGLVICLAFFLARMPFFVALCLFLLYSGLLGATLSSIFYIYTQSSIITTFISAATMFGFMSLYGYFTHSDLTSIGNISLMVLIGLIFGLISNMFFASERFDYILSAIGVIVFALLTAYDTQKIKQLMRTLFVDNEQFQKVTLLGALTLYLDFINLFLFMLRFFGRRSEH